MTTAVDAVLGDERPDFVFAQAPCCATRPNGPRASTRAPRAWWDPMPIVTEATRLLDDAGAYAAMARAENPYGDGRASARICDALADWLAMR